MMKHKCIVGVVGLALLVAGCNSPSNSANAKIESKTTITGAGATFPYPIYAKWFDEYHKIHPAVEVNYQSQGSGAGIRQLLAGTVDFGASDMPMTDEQLKQAKVPVLHFPTVLGAVVPTYNITGMTQELNFTPDALAGIFLGKIKKWNDRELTRSNPGVTLPGNAIVVVHRSEGSGTTFVWTDYLSKVSPEWKSKVGAGASINWPTGLGAKGNESVSSLVKQTPYSIGYVELVYAIQNQMPFGKVRNADGAFVKAELSSVTAAAASAKMAEDFRVSITNPPGKDAYPIASFTWLLIPERISDAAKKDILTDFLKWMLTEGQKLTQALSYAPLPPDVVAKETAAISKIQ